MDEGPKLWFKKYVGSAPYPYQEAVIDDPAPWIIINKARQTGMTTALGFKCLLKAISGGVALIASPSQRQSYRVMSMIESFISGSPLEKGLIEDSNTIKGFDNGGRIHSLPNSASQIRGYRANLIVLDEFAHFLNGTDKEVYNAILPSAARGGQVVLSSTPFGVNNMFSQTWGDPDYKKVSINWRNCPALKEEAIRVGYDELSFDQEYNNVFQGETVSEFPMKLLEKCIDPEAEYEIEPRGPDLVAAADIGRRIDFTAVVVLRPVTRENGPGYQLIEKHVWRNVPLPEQEERFVAIANRVGKFIYDAGGLGEQMGDSLPRRVSNAVPFHYTHESKTEIWLNFKRFVERAAVRWPFDQQLLASINSVRRYWRLGRTIIDADRKDETGHADEATALALACWQEAPEIGGIADSDEAGTGRRGFQSGRRW